MIMALALHVPYDHLHHTNRRAYSQRTGRNYSCNPHEDKTIERATRFVLYCHRIHARPSALVVPGLIPTFCSTSPRLDSLSNVAAHQKVTDTVAMNIAALSLSRSSTIVLHE